MDDAERLRDIYTESALTFQDPDEARCTAYHEAGHAVAGVGLGCSLDEVYVRENSTGGVRWAYATEGQSIAQVRRQLISTVAGPVAEFLLEAEELEYPRSRWADRLDPGDWEASYRLLSVRIRQGEVGDEEARCDTSEALRQGTEVCRRLKLQDAGEWDERRVSSDPVLRLCSWAGRYWMDGPTIAMHPCGLLEGRFIPESAGPVTPPEVTVDEVIAEVVRAERWAEKLLTRRWAAVKAMAEALYAAPGGTLSGEIAEVIIQEN